MKEENSFIWNTFQRIFQYLTPAITTIILARLLEPYDFGLIAIVNAIYVLLNVFVWDGLANGLIQKKDSTEEDFSSILILNFIISVIIYIIIFFISDPVSNMLKYGKLLSLIIKVVGIRVLFSSVLSVENAYVARKLVFRKKFFPTLISSFLSCLIGIVMAIMGFGIWSLVTQYMVATIVETILLTIWLKWKPKFYLNVNSIKPIAKFSWKILAESLLNNIGIQIRSLIVGIKYSPEDLGFYSKGQQFPSLISNCFCVPLNSTLFPLVSNNLDSKERVREVLRSTITIASFILVPVFLFMCISSNEWIIILLTSKWLFIIPYLWIFSFNHILDIWIFTKNATMNGIGKSLLFMISNVAIKIVGVIIVFFCVPFGAIYVALSELVTNLLLFILVSIIMKKQINYNLFSQFIDILPSIVFALISAAFTCMIFDCFININNIWLSFCFKMISFFSMYIFIAIMLKRKEFKVILDFFRSKKGK